MLAVTPATVAPLCRGAALPGPFSLMAIERDPAAR
jgi:hypothetical protein